MPICTFARTVLGDDSFCCSFNAVFNKQFFPPPKLLSFCRVKTTQPQATNHNSSKNNKRCRHSAEDATPRSTPSLALEQCKATRRQRLVYLF